MATMLAFILTDANVHPHLSRVPNENPEV